jgi:hypothetical protein
MSTHGPEQQITVDYTLTDLLELLGAASPENKEAVERIRLLSVAAMDIESVTRDLDLGAPGPGHAVGYANVEQGGAFMEAHARKSQIPVMIAHVDQSALENEGTSVFTASGDKEEDCFSLLSAYWEHVLACHRRSVEHKRKLARPLIELVDQYRRAFVQHSAEWMLRDQEARKLWLQDETGKLVSAFPSLPCRLLETEPISTERQPEFVHLRELAAAASSSEARRILGCRLLAAGGPASDVTEFLHLIEAAHSSKSWNGSTGSAGSEDLWTAPDHRSLQSAWNQSLPGKLESELQRLLRSYTVFTFYG